MKNSNKFSLKLIHIVIICITSIFFLTANFSCSLINNLKNYKEPTIKQQDSSYLYANPSRNAVYDLCSTSTELKLKWKKKGVKGWGIAYDGLVITGYDSYIYSNPAGRDVYPGHTYALDIETGKVVWEKDADFGPITICDEIIYFLGQAGAHYAVEAKTGKELWSINFKRSFCSPIVYGDLVYVGGKDAIYAFNAKTGEETWKYEEEGQFSDLVLVNDKIACQIYYPYADLDNYYWIYRSTTDFPDLLILDTKTGKKVKRYKSVYFHGYDGRNFYIERRDAERKMSFLVALDRKTDSENWRFKINEQSNLHRATYEERISNYIISKDNRLYFSAVNGSVYCLDSKTGELIWETTFERSKILPNDIPFPGDSPSFCNGKLYVVMDERLYILDAENGKKLFKFSTGGRIWSTFIYRNKILITSSDGFLYCLK
jgi:outer membrane protein assembly factor BamB